VTRANREPRLLGEEPENLPNVVAIFSRDRIVLQEIENFAEDRLIREEAGDIPGQEARGGKESVLL